MISIITRIQVEGNDTVSFLNGTTPPYQYVQGMSQIMPQVPTYISYGYDSISITQDGSKTFQFSVYTVTDVGGNTFPALTFQDPSTTVQEKTIEIYRLLVTSVFKGCCECGNTEPECSIQYTAGTDASVLGVFYDGGSAVRLNYFTANNQDFTGFWPIIQDGSWLFIFSKTDPTVYGVYQLSNYSDGGTFAQFDASLIAGPAGFPDGTSLCVDVTSVGGSLVQGWQDTLDINSTLDKDNTVDGGGFDFVFDNNNSFTINSANGSVETDILGASLNGGTNQVLVTPTYVNVVTPGYAAAGTGWVLAKDASGHVEYVEAGTGTISSIGLNMPPAFTVSTPNPLTSNGEFTVDGAGTELQYINGLGELATVPVYTVANGLHTQETPADPNVFHLGGQLIEDTVITTTDGTTEYVLGVSGTVNQNSRRPLSVSNLGQAGAAVFSDYSSGFRANASVQMLTDNDLFQPILDLTMQGDLPAGGILNDRTTMLRLKYDGTPAIGARTSIDYQFKSDAVSPANPYFIAGRLTTEITNFTVDEMESNFELQLFSVGSRGNKLVMEGKGQLELTNYATSQFWNGDTNINNSLTYVLAVDGDGKVWKKFAEGGGTVQSVSVNPLTGISASVSDPTVNPVITIENTAPDQIVILNAGDNITITGTYPEFTINADGGTGTVEQVNTAGLITGGPITTTGTITTSVNENRLVGRWDAAGTGIMQEITIGTNLDLTAAGVLNATGGGETYTVNNGLSPDPLDANNFQLGGPLVQDTTITGGTVPFTNYLHIDNLSGFSLDVNGKGYLIAENGDDKTQFTFTNKYASSKYDNNLTGETAEVLVGGDSSISDVKAYLRASTVFGETGIYAGVIPGFLPYTANMLGIKTPKVANGTATVGQVLTLKSMTGSEAGRVEFEDAGGSSPLTTKGDIYTYDTADARLPVGTDGQMLYADSTTATGLKWDDAPTGGIPFGIATGTDTYAVSAGTASTYTDGDAYLVRFTNGNTGASTLNVNGIGDADMYSNSDGLLIGGDIWAESQMLCVYDSSLPGFKCIGTSTNSLFAYVTNAEATTITKGMAVYAAGGTGDRMTVMKALATGDSTSAQTVGIVFADIAAGQKGIILIQGELTGLNLFPTSGQPVGQNWSDGDPIYLSSATAGALTKTKQYAPNHLVYLGVCVKASNGSAGRMYVRIQNGYELDELHNVQAQSPADKDTLWYDNSVNPKQWKTASIPTILGYTPVPNTRTLTINSTTYDLSADRTWTIANNATSLLYQSQNATNTPASSTYYGCLFGGALSIVSAPTLRRTPIATAGTITKLYVQTSTAQPATGSLVCTVQKNSVDQALTLTIAAGSAAGVFTDLVNSVSVVAGDLLGMKFVNNATTVSANVLSNQVILTI